MKKIMYFFVVLSSFLIIMTSFPSCDEESSKELKKIWKDFVHRSLASLINDGDVSTLFGWYQEDENLDEIESSINLGGHGNLSSSVDLTKWFPPIGNQGSYGTCVAWAVGYNLRSFLNAKDGNFKPNSASQQYSPKDLFWSIPNSSKGKNCNGTNFEPALDVLVSRGIASLSDVPYTGLSDCSDAPPSSWNNAAAKNKILNYRKINNDVKTVKSYLSQGRAVVIGSRLGDNFMIWDDHTPISSDTYNNPGMQHAYHAMILSGYDDSKNAFRVVNSWDTGWGDKGYIWVDYNFFVNSFCFAAFVAENHPTENPDENDDNIVDPDQVAEGYDLLAWELYDFKAPDDNDKTHRKIKYNVFNSGTKTIPASFDWNIIYIYYNAYDANDYGILLFDYYSDDYGAYGDDGELTNGDGISNSWWNHVDAPAGQSLAQALYGGKNDRFNWGYYMPTNITGSYYLVLWADGYNAINEENEENNFYFFTDDKGDPVYVENGVINYNSVVAKSGTVKKPDLFDKSPKPTAVNKRNVNTYSPAEIRNMILKHKENGNLQKKIEKYLRNKKNKVKKTADK